VLPFIKRLSNNLYHLSFHDNDDDVYLKEVTKKVSQNTILNKNADQPEA
jgi:hypothetical protein